ncbi:MAG: hypothetical protein LUC33_00905 [Prevotellaceae bacterium]|nr:hypothetical protein [Prevotellaceae bacterium]
MASSGINLENLTLPNGAVQELNQLIWLTVLGVDKLGSLITVVPNAKHGDKLGIIGRYGSIVHARVGCNPTYYNHLVAASEKTWDLSAFEIAEQSCFEDVEATCAYNSLHKGTDIADFTGTDYLNDYLQPLLEEGLTADLFKMAWFGDKDAVKASDGGTLSDECTDDDIATFTVMDGFFKRIEAVCAADPERLISIAANDEDTWDAQYNAIRVSGVATGILNQLITKAKIVLRDQADKVIYVTQALADAWEWDVVNNFKGSAANWTAVFDGVQYTTVNGVKIVAIPYWDNCIQTYGKRSGNGAYYKPFRALFTTVGNLMFGTPGTTLEGMAKFDVIFNKETRLNKVYGTDKGGTLLLQDDLVQYAA